MWPRMPWVQVPSLTPFTHKNHCRLNFCSGFKFPEAYAPVAQLDRAPDFESVGRGFESLRACHKRKDESTEFLVSGSRLMDRLYHTLSRLNCYSQQLKEESSANDNESAKDRMEAEYQIRKKEEIEKTKIRDIHAITRIPDNLHNKITEGIHMLSFNLDEKIAVVTGASRGIGRSIAETFAEYGAEVVLVSRKIEPLTAVSKAIAAKGGKSHPVACHMGDINAIKALYDFIEKTYGRLDILVNNAATNPYFGEMAGVDENAWNKTFDVNLKGPFFMIRNAIPLMQAAGGGAIVNVSSVNGIKPAQLQGIYSVTKGALITMTKAYAKELAPHKIRVNALLPGFTDTKFSAALMQQDKIYKYVIDQIPMGRHADPKEMAGAVLYLVSDAASFTTGTCITCDGGYLA